MINFGEALKYQREINSYSQSALAKATGISQPKISYYESGKHIPPLDDCITLANFYGITLDELISLSDTINGTTQKTAQPRISNSAINFAREYEDIITDKNFVDISKLYKTITPNLRGLILGYIVGILQSQGIDTKLVLGY